MSAQSAQISPQKRKYGFMITCECLMLRIFRWNAKITRAEISARTFIYNDSDIAPDALAKGCTADILDLSKELFRTENDRFVGVQDKVKSLIAICALVLPLTSALMPRIKWPVLDIIPLLFFIVALLFLLNAIRMGSRSVPALDDDLLNKPEDIVRGLIAQNNMVATRRNQLATDYIVELYRGGLIALLLGLLCLVCLVGTLPWMGINPTPSPVKAPTIPSQPTPRDLTGIALTECVHTNHLSGAEYVSPSALMEIIAALRMNHSKKLLTNGTTSSMHPVIFSENCLTGAA